MCIYIIPGDELGNLATVISTKIWTNQMKVIQCLMSAQEQWQNYVDSVVKLITSFQTNCFDFVSTVFSPIPI